MDEQTRSDLEGMFTFATDHWRQKGNCLQICFIGSVLGHENRYELVDADRLKAVFKALGFRNLDAGWNWNDAEGRTKDQVLHRIKDALNEKTQVPS